MFDRKSAVKEVRQKLKENKVSIGSWMQLNSTDVAEIMGKSSYDWIAIDLEHGSISFENFVFDTQLYLKKNNYNY